MNKSLAAALCAAVLLSGPALAQGNDPVAVLASKVGNVTVSSNGSTFAGSSAGQALRASDRLMLVEGSAVTLRFDNGCTVNFSKPGVYTVPQSCKPVAAVDWRGAGIIATGTAVVAAALASMDNVPAPPASR